MLRFKKIRIVLYLLLVCWMTFIFIMSSQQAGKSAQTSGDIVNKLITVFFKKFDTMTLENQTEFASAITFIIRKTAHFLEFFILGVLSTIITLTYDLKYRHKALITFIFCLLYAISDETHQLFVQGRACRFTDVCIDIAGSLVAIIAVILVARIVKRRKEGEEDAKKEID